MTAATNKRKTPAITGAGKRDGESIYAPDVRSPVANDPEVEASIIGAALAMPDEVESMKSAGVCPDWFYDPANATVWRTIERCQHGIIEAKQSLCDAGNVDLADRLHGFIDLAPVTGAEIPWLVGKLREHHHRRQLREVGLKLMESAHDGDLDAMLSGVRQVVEDVEAGNVRGILPPPVSVAEWSAVELPPPDPVLTDAFDLGTKAVVVGPSKARKSFFVLQMLLSVAADKPRFLQWEIPKARRVLMMNPEIPASHYQQRVKRTMAALGINPDELGDRFTLINCRGIEPSPQMFDELIRRIKGDGIEVFCVDPVYKLFHGDESDQREIKALLRLLDGIANAGCAVLYSHHSGKGIAGDKQVIDRPGGSGVLARDFDWLASLAPHQTYRDTGTLVVEQVARSYPPLDPFCIRWEDTGCFAVADDLEPVVMTSRNADRSGKAGPALNADDAFRVAQERGPIFSGQFVQALRDRGFTKSGATSMMDGLVQSGRLARMAVGFPRRVLIGEPDRLKTWSVEV